MYLARCCYSHPTLKLLFILTLAAARVGPGFSYMPRLEPHEVPALSRLVQLELPWHEDPALASAAVALQGRAPRPVSSVHNTLDSRLVFNKTEQEAVLDAPSALLTCCSSAWPALAARVS